MTANAAGATANAWGGDAALRRAVLEQMAGHVVAGRLGTVLAREATLQLYEKGGIATAAAVLELPEVVLRVGYVLWEGLHDIGAPRQTIENAREIYTAIAAGADLSSFAGEFAAWVLADPDHGFIKALPPALAERAQDDADLLLLGVQLEPAPPEADATGYLAARRALVNGEVGALAALVDVRLLATAGEAEEKLLLDALRNRFRNLVS